MRTFSRFNGFLIYFAFFFLTSVIGELIGGTLTIKHAFLDAGFALTVSLIFRFIFRTKIPARKE